MTETRKLLGHPKFIILVCLIIMMFGPYVTLWAPTTTSPYVKQVYDVVHSLKKGDLVFVVTIWRANLLTEPWGNWETLARSIASQGACMVILTGSATGIPLDDTWMNTIWGTGVGLSSWKDSPQYGVQFVYLGYISEGMGGTVAYSTATNFLGFCSVDYRGVSLTSIPTTSKIKNAASFKLFACQTGAAYVPYWNIQYKVPCIYAGDSGDFLYAMDMYVAGTQLEFNGARQGAEYAYLYNIIGGPSTKMATVGFLLCLFILAGIAVSNVHYFMTRSKEVKKEVS